MENLFFDVTMVTINSIGKKIFGQNDDYTNSSGGWNIVNSLYFYSKIHTVSDYRLFSLVEFLLQTDPVNSMI